MIRPLSRLALLCVCCLLLGACSARQQQADTLFPEDCEKAYTYAPGNYIIEIAGGSEVVLDPLMHDFLLFCSAKQAHDHVLEEISRHRLPRGDWRIYVVGASFRDLAQPAGGNAYVCMRMAPLADGLSAMPVAICAASNRRPRHTAAARRAGGEKTRLVSRVAAACGTSLDEPAGI